MTTQETLEYCFSCLSDQKSENLLWHVEAGTPICCGDDSYLYTDGAGGG